MPKARKNPARAAARIKANSERMVPTNSYSRPEYYQDTYVGCVDCKTEFVFTALEQLAWYEKFQIPHYATRVRCQHCSAKHNALEKMKREYDGVCAAAKKSNASYETLFCAAMLACEMKAAGAPTFDAPRTIGWLRKCVKLSPKSAEPLYWLARCYDLSGHTSRAHENYMAFLTKAGSVKRGPPKKWCSLAEQRIKELTD